MRGRPAHYNTRFKRDLTPQQKRVVGLIAAGKSNAEIASALDLSLDGVKWHVREVLGKLGFESREEIAAWWRVEHRPGRRLTRAFQGLPIALTSKAGLALTAGTVVLFGAAILVLAPWRGSMARADEACRPNDIRMSASTHTVGTGSQTQFSMVLRDQPWYESTLSRLGFGDRLPNQCAYTATARVELFHPLPAEPRDGRSQPARREMVTSVAGSPASLPVMATVTGGQPVVVMTVTFSNWCEQTGPLLLEASFPQNDNQTQSSSFTISIDSLPDCRDASAPARLEAD